MSESEAEKAKLWQNVAKADKANDATTVTSAVYSFLLHRLQSEASLTTGNAIYELEQQFRKEQMLTHCVARKTVEPYQSCTFDKQKTAYHLFLVTDTKAHVKEEMKKQGSNSMKENTERLKECGFLENVTEAVAKEKRLKAVKLPSDLDQKTLAPERLFDVNSLTYYATDSAKALELRNNCLQHASASLQGVLSEALSFSGLQVARTSVPLEKWQRTKDAMQHQMKNRLPIAETVKAAIDTKKMVAALKKVQTAEIERCLALNQSAREKGEEGKIMIPSQIEEVVAKRVQEEQEAIQKEEDLKTCIREQFLPIGYQLLGVTKQPPHLSSEEKGVEEGKELFALFDLYAVCERKYHVSFTDEEYAWLQEAKSRIEDDDDENVMKFRQMLFQKTKVESEKEMEGINFANAKRHVHIVGRGPMPL